MGSPDVGEVGGSVTRGEELVFVALACLENMVGVADLDGCSNVMPANHVQAARCKVDGGLEERRAWVHGPTPVCCSWGQASPVSGRVGDLRGDAILQTTALRICSDGGL